MKSKEYQIVNECINSLFELSFMYSTRLNKLSDSPEDSEKSEQLFYGIEVIGDAITLLKHICMITEDFDDSL